MKIIGLIKVLDQAAFEIYRSQVGQTVALYHGKVEFRAEKRLMPWNELRIDDFDAFVEVVFRTHADAESWTISPEYAALLPIRSKAMSVTLFGVSA